MRSPEYIKLKESAEIKPNRYAAKVLLYIAVIAILFLLVNELDIIHVNKNIMRGSALVSLVLLLLPSWIVSSDERAADPKSKYEIMLCVILATLILTIMLSFHATLVLAFPVFLSTLYRSRKIGYMSCVAAVVSAVAAPFVSYQIGTWDYVFGGWIMETYYGHSFSITLLESVPPADRMTKILLYNCLPNILILLSFSFIVFAVLKRAEKDYQNQVEIIRVGETDSLTGLLNRHCYDASIELYQNVVRKNLTCIYWDCNGLHELNNQNGHARGDEFLVQVAKELIRYFGEDESYRIGGDEFVVFQTDTDLAVIEKSVSLITQNIEKEGYSISVGIAHEGKGYPIPALIKKAEENMYKAKQDYYARSRDSHHHPM